MKKQLILCLLLMYVITVDGQTADQLFKPGEVKVTWLGIDFSHVKLIGDFSQFFSYGSKSTVQLRDIYFPSWNHLIMAYPKKFDIKDMLKRDDIIYDMNMIRDINSKTSLDNLESMEIPIYSVENMKEYVNDYPIKDKDGIGVVFIAECLNKTEVEAYFHFVAFNMKTKEILIYERLKGKPGGLGLKNYWASAILEVINDIKHKYYKIWQKQFIKSK